MLEFFMVPPGCIIWYYNIYALWFAICACVVRLVDGARSCVRLGPISYPNSGANQETSSSLAQCMGRVFDMSRWAGRGWVDSTKHPGTCTPFQGSFILTMVTQSQSRLFWTDFKLRNSIPSHSDCRVMRAFSVTAYKLDRIFMVIVFMVYAGSLKNIICVFNYKYYCKCSLHVYNTYFWALVSKINCKVMRGH
jgi:hypothetical protein